MTLDAAAVEALDKLFSPWNRSDAPGLGVGIVRGGAVVYRRGFGMASLESGVAITPATRLRIGSTTKHMTALLALLLAEAGKLDLDAPIRAYIPELAGPGGDPSARDLLRHRGGSRCYLDLGFIAHGTATPPGGRALAMQVRQAGRNFPVGEAMTYNNGGYHLVSEAIERVGGAPFGDQLKAALFDPLGLRDTALLPSDHWIAPGMATLHVPRAGGGWRRGLFPSEELRGEGGVVSTVDDMLVWTAHLESRDRFGRPETWRALLDLPAEVDGSRGVYALGMVVDAYRGTPRVHHAGGVVGGSSQMATFPDHGLGVVVMSNGAAGADPSALADRAADVVLGAALAPAAQPPEPDGWREQLGQWWSGETAMVYGLHEEEGAMKGSVCGAASIPLIAGEDGGAVLATPGLGHIAFARDGGRLSIRFGGRSASYERLAPPADPAAFAARAAGRYTSADADCAAEVRPAGDGIEIVFSDAFGESRMGLSPFSETVALARPAIANLPFSIALTFQPDGERFGGFEANTGRTRHLAFRRT